MERAVELQKRSYRLLLWMSDAIKRGFIRFETAHKYASLPEAAHGWLDRHYNDLPRDARPERDQLEALGNLFATYLESSFDLVRDPGKRRVSPDCHCFCPMCSWLVDLPHVRPKKLTNQDKKRARKLQADHLRAVALELDRSLPEERCEELLEDPGLSEAIALATYARDLFRRLEGRTEGPATLALWRRFAWTRAGSPKKGFELSAEAILKAEATVRQAIVQGGASAP